MCDDHPQGSVGAVEQFGYAWRHNHVVSNLASRPKER